MRFSVTAISLLSLVLGSNAADPTYTPTWDIAVDARVVFGIAGDSPLLLDNGVLYMANSTNKIDNPKLRFELIGLPNKLGEPTIAARLVGYPGYTADGQRLYFWQAEGGPLVYGPFSDTPEDLQSWWMVRGPPNDRQLRFTLGGNATAKLLWDASKGRHNVYVGSGTLADGVKDAVNVSLKLTAYCGPGPNDYCD